MTRQGRRQCGFKLRHYTLLSKAVQIMTKMRPNAPDKRGQNRFAPAMGPKSLDQTKTTASRVILLSSLCRSCESLSATLRKKVEKYVPNSFVQDRAHETSRGCKAASQSMFGTGIKPLSRRHFRRNLIANDRQCRDRNECHATESPSQLIDKGRISN